MIGVVDLCTFINYIITSYRIYTVLYNMSTQISFTADKQLKEQALKKASHEGITLKTLLVYAMKGFVDGKITFGLTATQENAEEIYFQDKAIHAKAARLAKLLQ